MAVFALHTVYVWFVEDLWIYVGIPGLNQSWGQAGQYIRGMKLTIHLLLHIPFRIPSLLFLHV